MSKGEAIFCTKNPIAPTCLYVYLIDFDPVDFIFLTPRIADCNLFCFPFPIWKTVFGVYVHLYVIMLITGCFIVPA